MLSLDTEVKISLKNILVATDFSSFSEAALDYGRQIARRYNSKIVLVHVIDGGSLALAQPETALLMSEQSRLAAQELLRKEAARLTGISYDLRLECGSVSDVLKNMVEQNRIDLVVLGTRGAGGLKKVLLGSTAEAIFREVRCPVLTVGPHAPQHPATPEITKILLPTDLLMDCSTTIRYAVSLAKEHHAQLTLLHVIPLVQSPPPADIATLKRPIIGRLRRLLPEEAGMSQPADLRVEFGADPLEVILRVARELPADLLALSVRKADSWVTRLPDKASRIVAEAPCPVLTISEEPGC